MWCFVMALGSPGVVHSERELQSEGSSLTHIHFTVEKPEIAVDLSFISSSEGFYNLLSSNQIGESDVLARPMRC